MHACPVVLFENRDVRWTKLPDKARLGGRMRQNYGVQYHGVQDAATKLRQTISDWRSPATVGVCDTYGSQFRERPRSRRAAFRMTSGCGHSAADDARVSGILRPAPRSNGPMPSRPPSRRALHRGVGTVCCTGRHKDEHISESFLSSSPAHFSRGRSPVPAETVSIAQFARSKCMSVERLFCCPETLIRTWTLTNWIWCKSRLRPSI